jgi:hypothetical protein
MVSLEMVTREGDELAIGQLINTFNTNDLGHQRRVMTGNVLDQLRPSLGGPGDEYRAGIGNGVRTLLKIDGIDSRVTAADSVGLMVDMTCRIVRVNNNTIGIGDIEMKNPGFQMVDPDDCVIVHGHKCSFRVAVAQPAERATETALPLPMNVDFARAH